MRGMKMRSALDTDRLLSGPSPDGSSHRGHAGSVTLNTLEKRRCVIFFRDNGGRVLLLSLMKNVFCACAPPKLSRYIFFPLNGIIVEKSGTDAK